MSLLVSMKILFQSSVTTRVVREWRIVALPDGNQDLDVVGLYRGICCRTFVGFDQLEPYVAVEGDRPIRVQVGTSETGTYQDIPLLVKVADTAKSFGIYFKFFVVQH